MANFDIQDERKSYNKFKKGKPKFYIEKTNAFKIATNYKITILVLIEDFQPIDLRQERLLLYNLAHLYSLMSLQ